jgi:hypothetical protein
VGRSVLFPMSMQGEPDCSRSLPVAKLENNGSC